ncbi:MAG: MotA/TolQ/ExbB proton channel family protein [Bdellovibrionia bacterium]
MGPIDILIHHGGFVAYLIFFAGIALFILGAERLTVLFVYMSYNTKGAITQIRELILEQKYTDAIQICGKKPNSPELSVVKAGLIAVENGREAMKSALSSEVLNVSHRCEVRVGYIGLIANVATLLGLLGTISGLIKTFASIANADPAEKARLLGLGISEAMYATAAGLVVGMTAMVVHSLCVSQGEAILAKTQDIGLKVITWVEQSERVEKV